MVRVNEIKFPGPTDGDGCRFALVRGLTTLRRLAFVVIYAAIWAPVTDAVVNVLTYPR